jgi:predicted esterase
MGPPLAFPPVAVEVSEQGKKPGFFAYPPQDRRSPRPVTVFLHGMCDEPQNECPWIEHASTEHGWLLCPRATLRCNGGGSIWPFDDRFPRSVDASLERLSAEYPGTVDVSKQRTLVGFSLGAIRAAELAQRPGSRWESVILIGAKVELEAKRLRRAGVKRVVLASGDHDMMKWRMVEQAKKLRRQGFPVAFMSLGKVGHWFPRDMEQRMRVALDWAHGDDAAFAPKALGELEFVP